MQFQPDAGLDRIRCQANSRNQTLLPATGIQSNDFDCCAYLDEINGIETNVERSDIEVKAMNAGDITPDHVRRAYEAEAEQSFLMGLAAIRDKEVDQKWATTSRSFLQDDRNDFHSNRPSSRMMEIRSIRRRLAEMRSNDALKGYLYPYLDVDSATKVSSASDDSDTRMKGRKLSKGEMIMSDDDDVDSATEDAKESVSSADSVSSTDSISSADYVSSADSVSYVSDYSDMRRKGRKLSKGEKVMSENDDVDSATEDAEDSVSSADFISYMSDDSDTRMKGRKLSKGEKVTTGDADVNSSTEDAENSVLLWKLVLCFY